MAARLIHARKDRLDAISTPKATVVANTAEWQSKWRICTHFRVQMCCFNAPEIWRNM
jgi:hypothetical protein